MDMDACITKNARPESLQWLERFLEMLVSERGVSPKTVHAYQNDISGWLSFLMQDPLIAIGPHHRSDYIVHLKQKGLCMRSIARHISSFRQFMLFLLTEGVLIKDPWKELKSVRYDISLPYVLTGQDIQKLLDYASKDPSHEGKRLWALIEMLYATGMRISELIALRMHQLSEENYLYVTGKGGHERVVFFTAQARKALMNYLSVRHIFLPKQFTKSFALSSLYFFPSRGKEGHLTRQRVGQLLKNLAVACQIPQECVSPHMLRHAFATHLLQAGMDLISLKQILGHKDISSTQIYTHVDAKKWASMLARCHPLGDADAISDIMPDPDVGSDAMPKYR
jgi:integrase/recombinase XerD